MTVRSGQYDHTYGGTQAMTVQPGIRGAVSEAVSDMLEEVYDDCATERDKDVFNATLRAAKLLIAAAERDRIRQMVLAIGSRCRQGGIRERTLAEVADLLAGDQP